MIEIKKEFFCSEDGYDRKVELMYNDDLENTYINFKIKETGEKEYKETGLEWVQIEDYEIDEMINVLQFIKKQKELE